MKNKKILSFITAILALSAHAVTLNIFDYSSVSAMENSINDQKDFKYLRYGLVELNDTSIPRKPQSTSLSDFINFNSDEFEDYRKKYFPEIDPIISNTDFLKRSIIFFNNVVFKGLELDKIGYVEDPDIIRLVNIDIYLFLNKLEKIKEKIKENKKLSIKNNNLSINAQQLEEFETNIKKFLNTTLPNEINNTVYDDDIEYNENLKNAIGEDYFNELYRARFIMIISNSICENLKTLYRFCSTKLTSNNLLLLKKIKKHFKNIAYDIKNENEVVRSFLKVMENRSNLVNLKLIKEQNKPIDLLPEYMYDISNEPFTKEEIEKEPSPIMFKNENEKLELQRTSCEDLTNPQEKTNLNENNALVEKINKNENEKLELQRTSCEDLTNPQEKTNLDENNALVKKINKKNFIDSAFPQEQIEEVLKKSIETTKNELNNLEKLKKENTDIQYYQIGTTRKIESLKTKLEKEENLLSKVRKLQISEPYFVNYKNNKI